MAGMKMTHIFQGKVVTQHKLCESIAPAYSLSHMCMHSNKPYYIYKHTHDSYYHCTCLYEPSEVFHVYIITIVTSENLS